MKILLVHNNYQSKNIGGEDIVFKREFEGLAEKLGRQNVLKYELYNDEVSKLKLLFTILFSVKSFVRIFKLVKGEKIHIVHVHNFFPLLTPSCFLAAKLAGAKLVHTLHNYRIWCISGIFYRSNKGICEDCVGFRFPLQGIKKKCYRNSFIQSLAAQISFSFYRFIGFFKLVDQFFVLTNFQFNKVRELGLNLKKISIKPNFLDIKKRHIQTEKEGYIFVGRLEEAKGIEELLSVWENLDDRFQLKIIGNGDQEFLSRIQKMKNIQFFGKQDQSFVMDQIAMSRYLIQSSILYETFGLTTIEAFSQGTPVIGFDIGTRPDFINHKINGFLTRTDRLRETILESFSYNDYEQMSKNALAAAERFQADVVLNDQIDLYKRLIGDKKTL